MDESNRQLDAAHVAKRLAKELNARGQEYAIGGAIALGYWAAPRGTIDVDVTLYWPPGKASECIWLLQEIGCEATSLEALQSIKENGFCRVSQDGLRVDVFLPTSPFYADAKERRQVVDLDGQAIVIWDAESLVVFKMMFFRRKDLADVEQVLRTQLSALDRGWIREKLVALYGARDPRISQWDELLVEVDMSSKGI